MALEFKPKPEQLRLVFTDDPSGAMSGYKDKIFALIGPFENFDDKPELQHALMLLIRGWNIRSDAERPIQ